MADKKFKYLTTIIPYQPDKTLPISTLQVMANLWKNLIIQMA